MVLHYAFVRCDRHGEYNVHVELTLTDDEVKDALTDIFIDEHFKEIPYTPELRKAVRAVVEEYDIKGLDYDYDDYLKDKFESRAQEIADENEDD